jgi:outer membrane protein W
MSLRLVSFLAVVAVASPLSRLAAQAEPFALAGRHHITLSAGLSATSHASTSVGLTGVSVESGAGGALGGIGYSYWLDDRLAVGIRVAALDASADVTVTTSGTHVESGVLAAVLLGARWQPSRLTASNVFRPYVGLWVGPLIGNADGVTAGLTTVVAAVRQTTVSGLATIGADLSLGRRITLGADVGYLLTGRFDKPIGARTDCSSPVFTLSIGLLLGAGQRTPSPEPGADPS